VSAEKKRLLDWLVRDSVHRRRENNRIRLAPDQRVEVPAIICVECFLPSNIDRLIAAIDEWPVSPSEYRQHLQQKIREWRSNNSASAWSLAVNFAQPNSGLLDFVTDDALPNCIKAVEVLLYKAAPSLTLMIAVFYPGLAFQDKLDQSLRGDFGARIDTYSIRSRNKITDITCRLPFSRARNVYYAVNFSHPTQLQKEWCDEHFAEIEAYCWHWLKVRAFGRIGALPEGRRPCMRVIFTTNLEPYGPIKLSASAQAVPVEKPAEIHVSPLLACWRRLTTKIPLQTDTLAGQAPSTEQKPEVQLMSFAEWQNDTSEEPIGGRHGPLDALGLSHAPRVWTTPNRDSFYFATLDVNSDSSLETAIISADRSTLVSAVADGEEPSNIGLVSGLVRNYLTDLISAWATRQILAKYRDDVSHVRDSTTLRQSAIKVAKSLNNFLVDDGHDAAVIARDVVRTSSLDYAFYGLPRFIDYNEQMYLHDGDQPMRLDTYYRETLISDARLVAEEIDSTTRSISASATLLQSVSAIRLQRWSLIVAVLAAVIAVVAVLIT
jgi:hypothetical protein